MKFSNYEMKCSFVINVVFAFLATTLMSCSAGSANAKQIAECVINNPAKLALAGGFTAPTGGDVRWSSGGVLRIRNRVLCPYLYSHVWGESGRATSRLVVFSRDYTYLGSYSLTAPRGIRSDGNILYITAMTGNVDMIRFESAVLPDKIYVDGELSLLFK